MQIDSRRNKFIINDDWWETTLKASHEKSLSLCHFGMSNRQPEENPQQQKTPQIIMSQRKMMIACLVLCANTLKVRICLVCELWLRYLENTIFGLHFYLWVFEQHLLCDLYDTMKRLPFASKQELLCSPNCLAVISIRRSHCAHT